MSTEDGIVVFDGVCSFCSTMVRFILENDVEGRLRFAPLQSAVGQELLRRHGIDPADAGTMLLVKGGAAYTRSAAALEIARDLGRWRWLRVLRVVPRGLRDRAYGVIARHRYGWFGKRDACFIPTAAQRARFLDLGDAELTEPD
jgi:predicted DCC family thiol-disulfide oxidoreductase YuxK